LVIGATRRGGTEEQRVNTSESDYAQPSAQMQGSYEGYMRSAPAYIQANGVGYDNPANQQARYSKNTRGRNDTNILSPQSFSGTSFNNISQSAILSDYSRSFSKNSSSQRLQNLNRIESMFG